MRDRFVEARQDMVDFQLLARGIEDPRVLEAMAALPRHFFLPPHQEALAYQDQAVAIGLGQTLSQPYIVAAMTEALRVSPGDRVLEVGTGSGYQAAVLARLALDVHSVERLPELARAAAERLQALGVDNVHVHVGDGSLGWPEHAPYDAIVVTAGAPTVPPALKEQLVDGGRLVAPVGDFHLQQLVRYVRRGPGEQGWHER